MQAQVECGSVNQCALLYWLTVLCLTVLLGHCRQKGFMVHDGRREEGNRRAGVVVVRLMVWRRSSYVGLINVNLIHHDNRRAHWSCDGDQAVDVEHGNGASQGRSAEQQLGLLTT